MMLVHICSRQEWEQAQTEGEYRPGSLEMEGFIHASRPEQVLGVANRFYRSTNDLLLLIIEPRRLHASVRWESADGDEYPHIYGPLNLDAVVAVLHFSPDEDGVFRQLPDIGLSPPD